jgi:hypothetical protein
MKRIALLGTLGLLSLVGAAPATAKHSPSPPSGSHRCVPHKAGYYAVGTLVKATLTVEKYGRYGGTLEVNLRRANHRAPTGDETFTLSGARVKFHRGVDVATPAPGSRVTLHGNITQLPKRCPTDGFTPTITVKKVDLRRANH